MKKTNIIALSEIKASDMQRLNDYLESQIAVFSDYVLDLSPGVITGMNVTQNGASGLVVSSGAIYHLEKVGELEGAGSGLVVPLPASGTRTDTVVASYVQVYDTPTTGWVLVDVDTQEENVQTNFTRIFGSAQVSLQQNTLASGITSGYVAVAQIVVASSGIVSINNAVKTAPSVRTSNGTSLKIDPTSDKTIKQYIDDLYINYDTATYTEASVNTARTVTYTEIIGTDTHVYTFLYDPHGYPYKVKYQKNSETPIIKKIVYDKFGNFVKAVKV